MIRKPLRPLARIFFARSAGENPDLIEYANRRERIEMQHERILRKTQRRLIMMGGIFIISFGVIGMRMTALAVSAPSEPKARATAAQILASRADIIDRNNRVLATNIETHSLYAHPQHVVNPVTAARQLAEIFPDIDAVKMEARLKGARKFLWLKSAISPEEKQAVHDIGDPGLLFGPREMRLYPNGQLAGHILGGTTFGEQGVHSAETLGIAGVEKAFDGFLRDPKFNGRPLQLSIDLSVQSAMEEVLYGGMRLMNAKAASAVLMEVHTGEILALSSLPDFDPNNRPHMLTEGDQADDPLFNRAVQGVYELGSVFKTFAVAQAMELGLVTADTMIDTKRFRWGKYPIKDFKNYGPKLTVENVLVKSSNVGTARLSKMIGGENQKTFLKNLGLLAATPIELVEGPTGKPQFPSNWSEISTMTISYGHGISTSPVHLASAYSTIVNGGTLVKPTVVKQTVPRIGERIISQKVSMRLRTMLRHVVTEGTASFGEVPGYSVAGKTGTADKPNNQGGYHKDKVLATFASFFPSANPKYVLIVTLDEPEDRAGFEPRRTAGWTAVPVGAEVIRRVAPLLGLAPEIETSGQNGLTLASN
ncbi:MAG: cell division protein FtsI (penicillin-binding protein 3) [Planktomarina sp.]|jgi:cell division protein FtsI (penicillin-binding protein 3)|tara:strand:+ start:533 stop:2311 length:1779 start_codon:yes stop_codon:yes gene_type:complete